MTAHRDFIIHALENIRPHSLQKAMAGLSTGRYTITLTTQTAAAIGAIVQREGAQYGVTLTPAGGFCSCPDYLFRFTKCCHIAMVALTIAQQPPVDHKDVKHLRHSDGALVCGLSEREVHGSLTWPWPVAIITHPEHWPEIRVCEACRGTYLQPRSVLRAAA